MKKKGIPLWDVSYWNFNSEHPVNGEKTPKNTEDLNKYFVFISNKSTWQICKHIHIWHTMGMFKGPNRCCCGRSFYFSHNSLELWQWTKESCLRNINILARLLPPTTNGKSEGGKVEGADLKGRWKQKSCSSWFKLRVNHLNTLIQNVKCNLPAKL